MIKLSSKTFSHRNPDCMFKLMLLIYGRIIKREKKSVKIYVRLRYSMSFNLTKKKQISATGSEN